MTFSVTSTQVLTLTCVQASAHARLLSVAFPRCWFFVQGYLVTIPGKGAIQTFRVTSDPARDGLVQAWHDRAIYSLEQFREKEAARDLDAFIVKGVSDECLVKQVAEAAQHEREVRYARRRVRKNRCNRRGWLRLRRAVAGGGVSGLRVVKGGVR